MNKSEGEVYSGKIMTVNGPIDPHQAGLVLPHEHVMSTFGETPARYPYYNQEKLLAAVIPYLQRIGEYGCQTLVDCTATHFGRHPELLREISKQSGLHILTNTGYYGAADDRYIPLGAYDEDENQIAARWRREWVYGIDDTGVRPGFIKTAVDDGPLSKIDRKLIQAAARAHLQNGLAIQTHVGDNWAVVQDIFEILKAEGVHPSAWIWTHAHSVQETDPLEQAAQQGAWLSLDGINAENGAHIRSLLIYLKERGYLPQVLLSHDGDSYFDGGAFRPYHYLFTDFRPQLEAAGFTQDEIQLLTVVNPQRAFTLGVRWGSS